MGKNHEDKNLDDVKNYYKKDKGIIEKLLEILNIDKPSPAKDHLYTPLG
jgi:hypothetical protein